MYPVFRSVLCSAGLLCVAAAPVLAQADQMHLGGRVDYHANEQLFGVGAQFSAPLFRRVEFYPSAEYYFRDGDWSYNANLDLKWRVPNQPMSLYAGSGVGIRTVKVDPYSRSEAGANFFGGFEPPAGTLHPFAELRVFVGRETHVGVSLGFNYAVGRAR